MQLFATTSRLGLDEYGYGATPPAIADELDCVIVYYDDETQPVEPCNASILMVLL